MLDCKESKYIYRAVHGNTIFQIKLCMREKVCSREGLEIFFLQLSVSAIYSTLVFMGASQIRYSTNLFKFSSSELYIKLPVSLD